MPSRPLLTRAGLVRFAYGAAISSALLSCGGEHHGSSPGDAAAGGSGSPATGGSGGTGTSTGGARGGTTSGGTTSGGTTSGGTTGGGGTGGTMDGGGTLATGGVAGDGGPPSGSMPDKTSMVGAVTDRGGVTWTFSQPARVGQFVTGDYYVVGNVTVTGISPAPENAAPYKNGSVKNLPTATGHSGFDQRLNDGTDQSWFFDKSFRLYPPFTLAPGDALVSAVSLDTPQTLSEPFDPASSKNNSPIKSMSVLTVLAAVPAAGAFRPSYCDRSQALYYAGNVQRSLLPSLAPPDRSKVPALSDYDKRLSRPWIDVTFFLWDVPGEYMASYSQHFTFVEEYAALLLTLDFPAEEKVNLTNDLVERGIDVYGCAKAGVKWPAWGGYGHGRKLPLLLAGALLNEPEMGNVSVNHPNTFGEDMQTVYVNHIPGSFTKAYQGATVIYAGHEGVNADGTTVDPTGFGGGAGPYEQLKPSAWTVWSGEQIGEAYRRCCTSNVWVGEALAARLLNLQGTWNYPAFFDYADRWMKEDDTQAVADIKSQSGFDYSAGWERQKQTASFLQGLVPEYTFIDDMWAAYR